MQITPRSGRAMHGNDRPLRARRRVLGSVWNLPFYFSAVSSMRAAASRNMQMMLSTGASCAIEEVIAARKGPLWEQLHATDGWHVTEAIVRRAEKAGCTAIVLTVDSFLGRSTEALLCAIRADGRDCMQCHVDGSHNMVRRARMFAGIDVPRVTDLSPANMSDDCLDATQALRSGADGIVISNHGGRNEASLRSTVECLPEIAAALRGHIPIFIDGGIRLGELRTIMRQAATPDLASIDKRHAVWSQFSSDVEQRS